MRETGIFMNSIRSVGAHRAWAAATVAAALALSAPGAQAGVEVGQAAPLFELPSEQPTNLALQQLRGQVVYLDFWASWCGPCRQSFPWMAEMHRRHAAQGLAVVAVNLDTRMADAQAFLKSVPAPFRIAYDPKGQTPREYAIKAMPTSLLIGRDGRIRQIHAGFRPSDTAALEAAILEALKESAK
ncbi:MAG: hypothetical protein RL500_618 [Pseudomonadota bacterium]|jgi:thiol-disulfide isomerase/thioredoxin